MKLNRNMKISSSSYLNIIHLLFHIFNLLIHQVITLEDDDLYISNTKLNYDIFLHANLPGGSIVNVKRPVIKHVESYKSYLILIKSDVIYSYKHVDQFVSLNQLEKFLNNSLDCKSIDLNQFNQNASCKLAEFDSNNFKIKDEQILYFIGNVSNNIDEILLNLAYDKAIYEKIVTQVVRPSSYYQIFYILQYDKNNETIFNPLLPTDLIKTNSDLYKHSIISNFNSNLKQDAYITYKNESKVELKWTINDNSSFCSIKYYHVFINDESNRSHIDYETNFITNSDLYLNTCGNTTIIDTKIKDVNCHYVSETSDFECNLIIDRIALNSLFSFKINAIGLAENDQLWQIESTYPPLPSDISIPNTFIDLDVSSTNNHIGFFVKCPAINQNYSSIYMTYLFLVYSNSDSNSSFRLDSSQNQTFLNSLIQNTLICDNKKNSTNNDLCILKIFDKSEVDFNNLTSILIGSRNISKNLKLDPAYYDKYIVSKYIKEDSIYKVFFIFDMRNPFSIVKSRINSNNNLFYSTNLSSDIHINKWNITEAKDDFESNSTTIIQEEQTENKIQNGLNTVSIIILCIFALLAIFMLAILLSLKGKLSKKFMRFRNNFTNTNMYVSKPIITYNKRKSENIQNITELKLKTSKKASIVNEYEFEIKNLAKICKAYHLNNDALFKEEFRKLPEYIESKQAMASEFVDNVNKNRYSDIKAYDETRVILDVFDHENEHYNDYINANFINTNTELYLNNSNDQNKKHLYKYIATQGPKKETIVDFWRMIDQFNIKIIIMLTNLNENNKIKCNKYWPNRLNEIEIYDNLYEIKYTNESKHLDYVKRTFKLNRTASSLTSFNNSNNDSSNNDNKNKINNEKVIDQYHFKYWYDKDSPNTDLISIFYLIKEINSKYNNNNNSLEQDDNKSPILIHCSAGIGRTGTYIALDTLMQVIDNYNLIENNQSNTNDKIELKLNIFDVVSKLRQYRQNLVQTYKQYAFIYDALNEYYLHGLTFINSYDFKAKYKSIVDNLNDEFNKLNDPSILNSIIYLYPNSTRSIDHASDYSNKTKNRNQFDVPYDFNRIVLPDQPSYYINASLIRLLPISKTSYVITQDPSNDTISNFLDMIVELNPELIVSLNKSFENVRAFFY